MAFLQTQSTAMLQNKAKQQVQEVVTPRQFQTERKVIRPIKYTNPPEEELNRSVDRKFNNQPLNETQLTDSVNITNLIIEQKDEPELKPKVENLKNVKS